MIAYFNDNLDITLLNMWLEEHMCQNLQADPKFYAVFVSQYDNNQQIRGGRALL